MGYNEMAEANIKVFQLLKDVSPNLLKFIESQKSLTESMANANQFVGIIQAIFNRVKTFEESINGLGERINADKFLSNEVLIRIDKNLSSLERQFELLKIHEYATDEQINAHFTQQRKLIIKHENETNEQINVHLTQQSLDIKTLINNIENEIREALNFNVEDNPLQKLHLLEGIEASIGELNKKINFNGEFKHISDNVSTTKNDIQLIKNHLTTAIEDNKRRNFNIPSTRRDQPINVNPDPGKKSKGGFWRKIFGR